MLCFSNFKLQGGVAPILTFSIVFPHFSPLHFWSFITHSAQNIHGCGGTERVCPLNMCTVKQIAF